MYFFIINYQVDECFIVCFFQCINFDMLIEFEDEFDDIVYYYQGEEVFRYFFDVFVFIDFFVIGEC